MKIFIEHIDGKINEYEFIDNDYSEWSGYAKCVQEPLHGIYFIAARIVDRLTDSDIAVVPFASNVFAVDKTYLEVTSTITRIWFEGFDLYNRRINTLSFLL
jgi:hypothetical protein